MRGLLDLLLPTPCAGCGDPTARWCAACASTVGPVRPVAVSGCAAPVYALGEYAGPLRAAIVAYKERGRRDLAEPLGGALADALVAAVDVLAVPTVWLVPVPSRPSAARRRGGQHVAALAGAAARALAARGTPAGVAPMLTVSGHVRDSVGLTRAQRRVNLDGRLRVRAAGSPPPGCAVVLVDDVVTTGATAESGVAALTSSDRSVLAVFALAAVPGPVHPV